MPQFPRSLSLRRTFRNTEEHLILKYMIEFRLKIKINIVFPYKLRNQMNWWLVRTMKIKCKFLIPLLIKQSIHLLTFSSDITCIVTIVQPECLSKICPWKLSQTRILIYQCSDRIGQAANNKVKKFMTWWDVASEDWT